MTFMYMCKDCNKMFNTKKEAVIHWRKRHKKEFNPSSNEKEIEAFTRITEVALGFR